MLQTDLAVYAKSSIIIVIIKPQTTRHNNDTEIYLEISFEVRQMKDMNTWVKQQQ